MIHSMEPLLPALDNLPVFYTVVISLLFMAGLSAYALYRRLRQRPTRAGIRLAEGARAAAAVAADPDLDRVWRSSWA